jgi:bacterioferritin (cytochrome b1)
MNSTKNTKNTETSEATETVAPKAPADRRNLMGAGMAALVGFVVAACSDDEQLGPPPTGTGGSGAGTGGSAAGTAGSGGNAGSGAGTAGAAGTGGTNGGSSGTGGGAGTAGNGGAAGSPATADADVAILNALLTAEYQAITAYSKGAGILMAPKADDPLKDLAPTILATAGAFLGQHKLHAEALVDQITALNGTPVLETDVADAFVNNPSADLLALLGNTTILNLLKFAAKAELAAAIAYTDVVASLEAAKTRLLATSIGGDESQHFIVLTALALGLATPTAALTPANAGGAVPTAFIAKISDKYTGLEKYTPFFA